MIEKTNESKLILPARYLFIVHAIVPVLLLIVLLDMTVLDGLFYPYLQITPISLFLYLLFFELPHIVASFVSYADKDYLNFYKNKLLWLIPVLTLVSLFYWYNPLLTYLFYIFYTMYHVVKQQSGITGLLSRSFSWSHKLWTWSAILIYSYGFLLVYQNMFPFTDSFLVSQSVFLLLAALYSVSFFLHWFYLSRKDQVGRSYFLLTSLVVFSSALLLLFGYPIVTIFLIRFVHDITAFMFYIVHDYNRNKEERFNFLYQILKPLKLPLLLTTPIFAIVFAAFLNYGVGSLKNVGLAIIVAGITHYYVESFMWKRDSLHRQQIKIVR